MATRSSQPTPRAQGMSQTVGAFFKLPIRQQSPIAFNRYLTGAAIHCCFEEFVKQFVPDEIRIFFAGSLDSFHDATLFNLLPNHKIMNTPLGSRGLNEQSSTCRAQPESLRATLPQN
jgi:hypothetical protein